MLSNHTTRSAPRSKFRLIDYAHTVSTGRRGADGLFVYMAGLGNQSGLCWQTDLAMAKGMRAGERSVTRWLGVLRAQGHIERTTIELHGRVVRAFRIIGPRGGSQNGGTNPPKRRSEASHSGGQNPISRIQGAAARAEYARAAASDDMGAMLKAIADLQRPATRLDVECE